MIIDSLEKAKAEINDTLFVCNHSKHKIGELVISAKKHIDQAIAKIKEQNAKNKKEMKGQVYDIERM